MSETDRPRPRRRRPLRTAVGLAVLLTVIGYAVAQLDSNGGGAPYCTATAKGVDGGSADSVGTYEMTPEQAANAATIAAVGISKGLPDRALTIALATAMQESGLRNLDHGDRDSLGLFQQRPSQGWGTPQQITDPVYSAGIFYDRLVEVKGYTRLPLTVAAQRVQLSGFPQAYAKHEPDATVLTAAFGENGSGATLFCSGPPPKGGDPERIRAELARDFGKEAPGAGARAGGQAGAQAAAPGEVVVQLKPGGAEERRGRAVAHWAVARSRDLGISGVSYGRSAWTAGQDKGRWQPRGAGAGPDEVRISVAR
ncbi:hypothetical protein OOK31_11805 [Streptomyces sp. NBC_00249]|uniref:hypothetical protein n=1 Tax=Streptomyces sp. NBC_00249 TaxID=2975690 RepID=UPI0022555F17|nr:hypothetical protein [Streptomyces sp. NBC_00249]MCX5194573.1 hypothetical protein [Streptomyces sp. NBC_00249]